MTVLLHIECPSHTNQHCPSLLSYSHPKHNLGGLSSIPQRCSVILRSSFCPFVTMSAFLGMIPFPVLCLPPSVHSQGRSSLNCIFFTKLLLSTSAHKPLRFHYYFIFTVVFTCFEHSCYPRHRFLTLVLQRCVRQLSL